MSLKNTEENVHLAWFDQGSSPIFYDSLVTNLPLTIFHGKQKIVSKLQKFFQNID